MNLLDHFHGPLKPLWPGFHNNWMSHLAASIIEHLPPTYFALPSGRFGIEVDVAAVERLHHLGRDDGWEPKWTPPPAAARVPFAVATDELEVRLVEVDGQQARLVGAVEFVSPANKDRPETMDTFVSKCHAYLTDGIGLVIVDVVTERHGNLHNELMARIGRLDQRIPGHLYATAYRPTGANGDGALDIWRFPLTVGGPLPTVPVWLLGGVCVPAELSATYTQACRLANVERAAQFFGPQPVPQPN